MFIFRRNDAEEKLRQKRFHFQSEAGRAYIHALTSSFRSYTRIIVSVLVQCSASTLKLMLWRLDTLLKESVDWKN